MKKILSAMLTLLALGGCNSVPEGISPLPLNSQTEQMEMNDFEINDEKVPFSNECDISLGETVNINGQGATIDDNCITISESGVYKISGKLENGIIHISCKDTVQLILDNASINNDSGAAIISESDWLIISCEEGTENSLSDGKEYSYSQSFEDKDKHKSALFSEGKLNITGKGILRVQGNKSEAITASEIKLKGQLFAEAEDNGIVGSSISCTGAEVNVAAGKDGVKADGDISLSDSSLIISAENDGVQAEGGVSAINTIFDIATSGDIVADSELSSKGVKAASLAFANCNINVSSTDHSLKADETADISGGIINISSSMGKGITADGNLTVNDAEISITQSEEGLESKSVLTVNGGRINITASDDGINAGGDDTAVEHSIVINSGVVVVNAEGDGLDSNGDIFINGGTVVVFGPVADGNSPLDWGENGSSLNITGGQVLAMGSMGMMMNPGGELFVASSLNAVKGDVITVADESGNVLISVTTPKTAQGVVFGGTADCKIYKNGTVTGEADENGIVTSGTVTGGTEITAGAANGFGGRGHGKHQDGEPPAGMPENPPAFDGATPPEPPDGATPPELPDGATPPELPDGATPPELPDGATPPELPDGATPPELPDGNIPATSGTDAI